jgi:DNA-binding response OmpR family regulator
VQTAAEGLARVKVNPYDLIVLDWMLPDYSGVELCRRIRDFDLKTPILMLTARSRITDKLTGFESGADDYLTKPFNIDELIARIRVLLRRNLQNDVNKIIKISDLEINTEACEVSRAGTLIELSPREYGLLEYLAVNKGKALDRQELLEHVWDENTDIFTNTVDVHIRYLRQKIDEGYNEKLIKTVKGKGYMLCDV